MPRCTRCGEVFERRDAADRYCRDCIRVLASRAIHPEPSWQPEWRRRAIAKDFTGRLS